MSDYTDYMEEMLFNHILNIKDQIYDSKRWIGDYLSKRKGYPNWITRDGRSIPVSEVTDSHLENLLNYIPENNVWHKVFSCEKYYRELMKKLPKLEEEDNYNDEIINTIY